MGPLSVANIMMALLGLIRVRLRVGQPPTDPALAGPSVSIEGNFF